MQRNHYRFWKFWSFDRRRRKRICVVLSKRKFVEQNIFLFVEFSSMIVSILLSKRTRIVFVDDASTTLSKRKCTNASIFNRHSLLFVFCCFGGRFFDSRRKISLVEKSRKGLFVAFEFTCLFERFNWINVKFSITNFLSSTSMKNATKCDN